MSKYSWDNGERLTKYEYPNGSKEEYSYDALGNRSTVGQSQWVYSKEGAVESGGGVTYSYDSKGNRVTRSEGSGQSKYNYSVHDRLMSIEEPVGTTKARYTYNSFGQRVSKEVGGAKTYFYYTEDGLASEFDKDGALIRSYLYEPNREWQERLLALRQGGQYFYSVADHLGTPQKLINKDATVGWAANYQAYGLAAPTTELITNPLRFPGQYENQESGLYQNFHRDYDPKIGAYGTQDPIAMDITGENRYQYVYGNPIMYQDVTGECPWCIAAASGALIDISVQLIFNGFRLECMDWQQVAFSAVLSGGFTFLGQAFSKVSTAFGPSRPTYRLLKIKNVLRIESHPIRNWMPNWFSWPHWHLDKFSELRKWHLPLIEPPLLLNSALHNPSPVCGCDNN